MTPFWHYYFDPKGEPWWQGNIYGNILASAVLSFGIIFTFYKTRLKCCNCWRPAHHAVKFTHQKTCHKHSTISWHAKIQRDHAEKYPAESKLLRGSDHEL